MTETEVEIVVVVVVAAEAQVEVVAGGDWQTEVAVWLDSEINVKGEEEGEGGSVVLLYHCTCFLQRGWRCC